jgi:hypothetical protein
MTLRLRILLALLSLAFPLVEQGPAAIQLAGENVTRELHEAPYVLLLKADGQRPSPRPERTSPAGGLPAESFDGPSFRARSLRSFQQALGAPDRGGRAAFSSRAPPQA